LLLIGVLLGIGFLVPHITGTSQKILGCTLMACMCDGREGELPCNSCSENSSVFQTGVLDIVRSCDAQEYQLCQVGDEVASASRVAVDQASCRYEVRVFTHPIFRPAILSENETTLSQGSSDARIFSASFDEQCDMVIEMVDGEKITVPTDHLYNARLNGNTTYNCAQNNRVQVSPDARFVAFEGSSWQGDAMAKGNQLVVYASDLSDFFIVESFGGVSVYDLSIDITNVLRYGLSYDGSTAGGYLLDLEKIVANTALYINPTTRELTLEAKPVPAENEASSPERISESGVIKKERIPEDLELGEYWYWFYFEEPHLLTENSSGEPVLIDKLQIISYQAFGQSGKVDRVLEKYLNRKMMIEGEFSWGYAESRIIIADGFREWTAD
jgi:hypothetical protein